MVDYSELKRLAQAAGGVDWKWWDSNSTLRLTTEKDGRHGADGDAISTYRDSVQCPEMFREFIEAASPAAVQTLISENERLAKTADCWDRLNIQNKAIGDSFRAERDQLKAENEALRQALRDVMTQVDGNIRETVRDCVNGHNDVQDIYGYCDTIEGLIDAAMSKEADHE